MNNYLYYKENLSYPSDSNGYAPSCAYPEYPWERNTVQSSSNDVYDAIRSMFADMGLDKENYGTENWNPLGAYIQPGQNVLIKPNFVMHQNGSDHPDDMESLVTHPSIIRCVIDYCLIALQGSGSLIVADSPVKDCNFSLLMERGGYSKLVEFYERCKAVPMPLFYDLRGPEEEGGQYQQRGTGILVNLGEKSFFYNSTHDWEKLRIPNYDFRKVREHHHGTTQEYLINSLVLDADVIISLPKPKTHRKNGYTAALKNFVGVNFSKEYLPHHTAGAVAEGGDEYKLSTVFKDEQSKVRERIDITRTQLDRVQKDMLRTKNVFSKLKLRAYRKKLIDHQRQDWGKWSSLGAQDDEYFEKIAAAGDEKAREGSWHGNDTLWRTVLDLNVAVEYADPKGCLQETRQRKILYLGDLIVAGEKEGPMAPSPKKTKALLFSENPVDFDCIVVKLMGFDWRKFVGLRTAVSFDLLSEHAYHQIQIQSNQNAYCGFLREIQFTDFDSFEPAAGWKGYVELRGQD